MSKAEESGAAPPAYTAAPGGAAYPTQQYPQQGYGAAPPPYAQGADGQKMAYSTPGAYQTQYQGGYYPQPGQPGASGHAGTGEAGSPVMVQPQTVHMIPVMTNPPESHMLFSVLATLCCCWPIGIFAIIKSMEVGNAISRGDRLAAESASTRAYQLAKWAVIAGVVMTVTMVLFLVVFYAFIFTAHEWDD